MYLFKNLVNVLKQKAKSADFRLLNKFIIVVLMLVVTPISVANADTVIPENQQVNTVKTENKLQLNVHSVSPVQSDNLKVSQIVPGESNTQRAEREKAEADAKAQAEAQAKNNRAVVARENRPATVSMPTDSVQAIAYKLCAETWGDGEWNAFSTIIMKESGWDVTATNHSSGAYGLAQALPGSKMASEGADWRTNPETQLRWMIGYIQGRYGSPSSALSFHYAHGWY